MVGYHRITVWLDTSADNDLRWLVTTDDAITQRFTVKAAFLNGTDAFDYFTILEEKLSGLNTNRR